MFSPESTTFDASLSYAYPWSLLSCPSLCAERSASTAAGSEGDMLYQTEQSIDDYCAKLTKELEVQRQHCRQLDPHPLIQDGRIAAYKALAKGVHKYAIDTIGEGATPVNSTCMVHDTCSVQDEVNRDATNTNDRYSAPTSHRATSNDCANSRRSDDNTDRQRSTLAVGGCNIAPALCPPYSRIEAEYTRGVLLRQLAELEQAELFHLRLHRHCQSQLTELALHYAQAIQSMMRVLRQRRHDAEAWVQHGESSEARLRLQQLAQQRIWLGERVQREMGLSVKARMTEENLLRQAFESCMREVRDVMAWHMHQAMHGCGSVAKLKRVMELGGVVGAREAPRRSMCTTRTRLLLRERTDKEKGTRMRRRAHDGAALPMGDGPSGASAPCDDLSCAEKQQKLNEDDDTIDTPRGVIGADHVGRGVSLHSYCFSADSSDGTAEKDRIDDTPAVPLCVEEDRRTHESPPRHTNRVNNTNGYAAGDAGGATTTKRTGMRAEETKRRLRRIAWKERVAHDTGGTRSRCSHSHMTSNTMSTDGSKSSSNHHPDSSGSSSDSDGADEKSVSMSSTSNKFCDNTCSAVASNCSSSSSSGYSQKKIASVALSHGSTRVSNREGSACDGYQPGSMRAVAATLLCRVAGMMATRTTRGSMRAAGKTHHAGTATAEERAMQRPPSRVSSTNQRTIEERLRERLEAMDVAALPAHAREEERQQELPKHAHVRPKGHAEKESQHKQSLLKLQQQQYTEAEHRPATNEGFLAYSKSEDNKNATDVSEQENSSDSTIAAEQPSEPHSRTPHTDRDESVKKAQPCNGNTSPPLPPLPNCRRLVTTTPVPAVRSASSPVSSSSSSTADRDAKDDSRTNLGPVASPSTTPVSLPHIQPEKQNDSRAIITEFTSSVSSSAATAETSATVSPHILSYEELVQLRNQLCAEHSEVQSDTIAAVNELGNLLKHVQRVHQDISALQHENVLLSRDRALLREDSECGGNDVIARCKNVMPPMLRLLDSNHNTLSTNHGLLCSSSCNNKGSYNRTGTRVSNVYGASAACVRNDESSACCSDQYSNRSCCCVDSAHNRWVDKERAAVRQDQHAALRTLRTVTEQRRGELAQAREALLRVQAAVWAEERSHKAAALYCHRSAAALTRVCAALQSRRVACSSKASNTLDTNTIYSNDGSNGNNNTDIRNNSEYTSGWRREVCTSHDSTDKNAVCASYVQQNSNRHETETSQAWIDRYAAVRSAMRPSSASNCMICALPTQAIDCAASCDEGLTDAQWVRSTSNRTATTTATTVPSRELQAAAKKCTSHSFSSPPSQQTEQQQQQHSQLCQSHATMDRVRRQCLTGVVEASDKLFFNAVEQKQYSQLELEEGEQVVARDVEPIPLLGLWQADEVAQFLLGLF